MGEAIPAVLIAVAVLFVAVRALRQRRRGEIVDAAEVGAVGWVAGTDWRVAWPVALADARRLVRHPALLVGIAVTPVMLWAAMQGELRWLQRSTSMALALVPLGWLTIVATNLVTLQPRRARVDELFAAAPAPQPVRTTGALLSGTVAVAAAVVLSAGWVAFSVATVDHLTGSPRFAEIGAGVLIVAGAAVVGVAVARWLPHLAFGVLAVLAVTFLQSRFMDPATWPWNTHEAHPGRFLGFLAGPTSAGAAQLEVRPAGWHLAYLAGLVLVIAVAALARDGFPRRLGAVLTVAVVAVIATGWVQTRAPSSAQVATMVGYLTEPLGHQTCSDVDATTYCAYDDQLERVDDWVARVTSIRALLPAAVGSRDLAVIDRVGTVVGNAACGPQPFFDGLHPAVVDAVAPDEVWPDDGAVHPGTNRLPCGGRRVGELFTAVQVGSWAVGLPASSHGLDVRCSGAGQARAVVALWLGGAVTPGSTRTLQDMVDEHGAGPMTFATWTEPPMWGVTFDTADVRLAIDLLDLPTEQVAATMHERWTALTDPSTPSTAVARLFDLDPPGPMPVSGARACR